MSIRRRRLDKGWSQSQLAEFCGLSLRTIQRIEKGQSPTMESLKALASVFETDTASLVSNPEVDESRLDIEDLVELKNVRKMKSFFFELLAFVLVVTLVCLVSWLFSPTAAWGGLLALGWGIALSIQAYDVFEAPDFFNKSWERRQLEKRLERKFE